MAQNGITYFKYDKNIYNGDFTKGCSLNGGEIDSNFYFLRRMDIVSGYCDDEALHLINVGDDEIDIPFPTHSLSGESINFSGTTYDGENGILDIWVNGENVASLSGFTVCDCETLINKINGLEDCLDSTNATVNSLAESLDDFKKSLDDIAIDGSINNENVIKRLVAIDAATKENKAKITVNINSISKLQKDTETIADSLEERKREINALSASIEKETDERKASDEEITRKINSLETSVNEKIEEDSKVIASVRLELTEHSESNEKEFKEIHNLIDSNKDSVVDIKKTLDDEIERAKASETELSNNIESVKTEINTNVKERLDHQDDDIKNISNNVDSTLAFAQEALNTSKEALDDIRNHHINDLVLDDDKLYIQFVNQEHNTNGVSLEKYNYSADEKTLHKNGHYFSAITDKDGGVVSWKTFNEHIQKYIDLSNKYDALQKEFNDYKNADVYYAGFFDIRKTLAESLLQTKYIVKKNNENRITLFSDNGTCIRIAIPIGQSFSFSDEMGALPMFADKTPERCTSPDGKEYNIYTSDSIEKPGNYVIGASKYFIEIKK